MTHANVIWYFKVVIITYMAQNILGHVVMLFSVSLCFHQRLLDSAERGVGLQYETHWICQIYNSLTILGFTQLFKSFEFWDGDHHYSTDL